MVLCAFKQDFAEHASKLLFFRKKLFKIILHRMFAISYLSVFRGEPRNVSFFFFAYESTQKQSSFCL